MRKKKIKKGLIIALIAACLVYQNCFYSAQAAANDITVILDGEVIDFDVAPRIINGRTMVPMRNIFEKLGMVVEWNDEQKAAKAINTGNIISLPIDSCIIQRNFVDQEIDVPAQVINNRTFVPLRVVSENAGADVEWNEKTNTVYITSNDYIYYIDWNDLYEYYGEVENGSANGYGIIYSKETQEVSRAGYFSDNQLIRGVDIYDNGSLFNGSWENGKFSGYGKFYDDNGNYYLGTFVDGHMEGTGEFYMADGSHYIGNLKNDKMNGFGALYSSNGSFFKGYFTDGEYDGIGTFYSAETNISYTGMWKNGEPYGEFQVTDHSTDYTFTETY